MTAENVMKTSQYRLEITTGNNSLLFYENRMIATNPTVIAVAYETRKTYPIIIGHGLPDVVLARAEEHRKMLDDPDLIELVRKTIISLTGDEKLIPDGVKMPSITVKIIPAWPEVIEEINKSINTAGRISKFDIFLKELAIRKPELKIITL